MSRFSSWQWRCSSSDHVTAVTVRKLSFQGEEEEKEEEGAKFGEEEEEVSKAKEQDTRAGLPRLFWQEKLPKTVLLLILYAQTHTDL